MKHLLVFLLLASFSASAQVPGTTEKQDTIFGLAVVIDTIQVTVITPVEPTKDMNGWTTIHPDILETRPKLITAVVQAYTVTTYIPPGDYQNFPHVTAVAYYRLEDCTEIQFSQLIAFKH